MAKRKAVQDAEVAAKPILEKGLLIVHTGPGKGKSTAAFGLALRTLGRGHRVGAQFPNDLLPNFGISRGLRKIETVEHQTAGLEALVVAPDAVLVDDGGH